MREYINKENLKSYIDNNGMYKDTDIMTGNGHVNLDSMLKPIFMIPKSCDRSVMYEEYNDNDNIADISQFMMQRMSQWPEAFYRLFNFKGYTGNAERGYLLDVIIRSIKCRLNYLSNNAIRVLIDQIINILSSEIKSDDLNNITTQLFTDLYKHTGNIDYMYTDSIYPPNQILFEPNMKYGNKKENDDYESTLLYHQIVSLASIFAMDITAIIVNDVYNILYRNLSSATIEDMQLIAAHIAPVFVSFRNTMLSIYMTVSTEILACDININPDNMYGFDRRTKLKCADEDELVEF